MIHDEAHHGLEPTGTRATDGDKASARYTDSEAGVEHRASLAKAERKLLLKLGKSITSCLLRC